MKIAISCDHRGAPVYPILRKLVEETGHELVEVPTCGETATHCDYPDMAWGVAMAVSEGRADRGVLICGSGIGMCIAANKVRGVRAALVHDDISAEMARRHNDSNIVCLSADLLGQPLIRKIVQIWLSTPFEGGRHTRRVNKITAIENGEDPTTVTE
ncbi:MAG: ribose 5-phosphate isomerase B [Phycisphaera sp.]|nr:ribose 5-phosphate isomerase B [Phycisphaera sp.]